MLAFANFYLIVFLLDALLSVLDGWLGLAGIDVLGGTRQLVALLALSASIPLYVALAASPSLPKRVFLPPVLFLFWVALGGVPLTIYLELEVAGRWLAICQLALAALALTLARRGGAGASWPLTQAQVAGPFFDLAHLARFAVANLLLAPVVLSALLVVGGAAWLRTESAGFLWVDLDGVHSIERTYVRGDREVRLVAMVHAADEQFYRDVIGSITGEGTVVLSEGVTDATSRLSEVPDLGEIAESLGLVAQTSVPLRGDVALERADVDAADLSDETVQFLQALGAAFRSGSLWEALAIYTRYAQTNGPEHVQRVLAEVVDARNAHLLERIDVALESYERAIVPWGALHMPGLEAGVLARGFSPATDRSRLVIRFPGASAGELP